MSEGAAFRGQPLLLLGALLVGWLALRVAIWQPPFDEAQAFARLADAGPGVATPPQARAVVPAPTAPTVARHISPAEAPAASRPTNTIVPAVAAPLEPSSLPTLAEPLEPVALPIKEPPAPTRLSARAVIGHNLLLAAGLAQMELPPALMALIQAAQPPAPGILPVPPMLAAARARRVDLAASRWSANGWLLLRRDATTPFLSGRPSYGRSQAGAVVRYRFAPASPLRPQAYLRASTALAGAREQELAAGVSARPLAGLPLRLAVEARLGETVRGTRVRPAAYAVTEFAPLKLPLGMRAEAYAQGGYVGGDYATAFVDGQARVERALARRGELELSAGVGAWGGAQKDAARLDIGPTAAVTFRLGDTRGRLAADYRFRVAGQAEPSSGPALTLSAGF